MPGDEAYYPLAAGGYAIEGFAFTLAGPQGKCSLTPGRLLGPPNRDHANNWISLGVEWFGDRGNERFHGGAVLVDAPGSILSRLVADLDRLRAGQEDFVLFPSPELWAFQSPHFHCRIARDPLSPTGWSMLCQCSTHVGWSGDLPLSPSGHEHHRFAGTSSLLLEIDADSLEGMCADVASFLAWLDRSAGDESRDT